MPAKKRLNPNLTYCLTVKHVRNNAKAWPGGGGTIYKHVIQFVDNNGEEYEGEYLTQSPAQDLFVEGLPQNFKVSLVTTLGDEIVPLLESDQREEFRIIKNLMKPVEGHSFDKAMGYAVQLTIANKAMQTIEQDDIAQMLVWADDINTWMEQKLTEREIG